MNAMIKAGSHLALTCGLACAALSPAWAVEATVAETVKAGAMVPAESVLSEGVVKKIDKTVGKITITHGEIRNLGMAPMTMMFRVKDPAMLDQVQAGQKIRFHVDIVNNAYTVVRITPVK
ncbi:MAG: copper-binding protein [Oxalobacteraceae bacterium]